MVSDIRFKTVEADSLAKQIFPESDTYFPIIWQPILGIFLKSYLG